MIFAPNLMHVLVVDDDPLISSLLKKVLFKNNILSLHALTPSDAKILLAIFHVDVIILDYMLPEENGLQFLTYLRKIGHKAPVIMLTASHDTNVKLQSLSTGAEDYLAKPFNIEELILRLNILFKRSTSYSKDNLVYFSGMCFNTLTNELFLGSTNIPLSTMEETLIKIFVDHLGEVVSKEDILTKTDKAITTENLNSIHVNIMRLRKKLHMGQNKCLKTVRNQGFLLQP